MDEIQVASSCLTFDVDLTIVGDLLEGDLLNLGDLGGGDGERLLSLLRLIEGMVVSVSCLPVECSERGDRMYLLVGDGDENRQLLVLTIWLSFTGDERLEELRGSVGNKSNVERANRERGRA